VTRPVGVRSFSTNDYRVRPQKMADMVAGRIRQMIARGELTHGEWLPTEHELMEQFGVSRPTLREAFRLLESDSLVTIRRGPPGGARVTVPGPEAAAAQFGMLLTLTGTTLKDVYEARIVMEPAAARLLAEDGTAADRKQLAAALEQVRETIEDPLAFGRMTTTFHQGVVALSGNKTLTTVVGMLTEIINRHIERTFTETTRPPEEIVADNRRALRSYEKLVTLVNARDGDGAEKHWAEHMRAVRQYLLPGADTRVVDLLY
jgi:DNA-binding FadR family transcriptional regulator